MIRGKYGRQRRNAGQQITFWVTDEEKIRLTNLAQERGCGLSRLVREAVRVSLLQVSHNSQK